MPNWFFLIVNFLYQVGLALWIGGTVALGAAVAPVLFRSLPRHEAGALFGPSLRRFARVRIWAVVLVIAGATIRYLAWETHGMTAWIVIRWLAIAFLAFSIVYEVTTLEPAMESRRRELLPSLPDTDPRRQEFQRLHHRAELLMRMGLIAALVALFFS
ncbi:MAG TPA: DUF4149 domain-containing protein [Thermoanaerobaculia bacterium]|jgi:hypothetical protein|nr:DUF4149 domain-containing protein [Thermoanaerobaculia bacterium]